MPRHRIEKDWKARLRSAIPFGVGQTKPKHFRDMAKVIWKNRDNLPYAWKVLSRGVCDGCALGVAGFHDWTIEGVHLCMTRLNLLRLNTMPELDVQKLADISALRSLSNAELRELGRLPFPMVRAKGALGFTRISWDDAILRIAKKIRSSDPRRIALFLTSRGITNEVYYVAQKAARLLGTNHIDNAARLCHSPSTGAMKHALGVAASTCSYKDWYGTDLVVFFGANPANDQPLSTKYLHEAKKLGTKVVMVNPYREPGMERYWVPSTVSSALFGTDIMDYWFPVAQGGDISFLYGVLKILIANGWLNAEFIAGSTEGFEELKARTEALDWATLEKSSGLTWRSMEEFAELMRDAKNAVFVWSMGITQHQTGGDAVSMILNLGLARGYVGRDKNGLMPIRGHSSVQGGAEMGAYSTAFPGGKPITPENASALSELYGFEVPDWTGATAPEMVQLCSDGGLDLLYCVGGNFLRTLPEPAFVEQALANVPLRVHQDIILTDQMLIEGSGEVILLPAKTRYEQDDGGTETTTERRVVLSPEIPRQIGEARAEWKIIREVAITAWPERARFMGCETGQAIRDEIARAVPFYDGIQLLKKGGDSFQYGGPHLCANGKFATVDGKGHFRTVSLPRPRGQGCSAVPAEISGDKRQDIDSSDPSRLRAGEVFFVSTRRGKQFNTLIYDQTDPLTGASREAVFMNPEDASELKLRQDDRIALVNELGRFEGRVFIVPIARWNLQVHWPEANNIIRRGVNETLGGVPDYNALVRIERIPSSAGR
ncbi:MAG: FdhF/YdeP family oxidoreductase [Verrucomicrobia bacterium]|nr:FdhF/YdeP family oxidoreductase [Verrucomicrobiota bacterium]